jgi:hypothetical protein
MGKHWPILSNTPPPINMAPPSTQRRHRQRARDEATADLFAEADHALVHFANTGRFQWTGLDVLTVDPIRFNLALSRPRLSFGRLRRSRRSRAIDCTGS